MVRKVVDKAFRGRAGGPSRQMPRVVLDAFAEALFLDFFKVFVRPLSKSSGLQRLPLGLDELGLVGNSQKSPVRVGVRVRFRVRFRFTCCIELFEAGFQLSLNVLNDSVFLSP